MKISKVANSFKSKVRWPFRFLPRKLHSEYIERIKSEPLNAEYHVKLAGFLEKANNVYAAIAEYRTALALAYHDSEIQLALAKAYYMAGCGALAVRECEELLRGSSVKLKEDASNLLVKAGQLKQSSLLNLSHNRYYRLKSIADHIRSLYPDNMLSFVDVGGGDGALCLFLPTSKYVLAEPTVNGISGTDLPFAEGFFDVVVSVHTLEHVPDLERDRFLDRLVSTAKRHVLLLNPFLLNGVDEKRRLELILELTSADWAREHLDCALPSLEEVKRYAVKRGLGIKVWPNGNLYTTLALVFLEHYAAVAGKWQDLEKVNVFFNELPLDILTSPSTPTSFIIELDKLDTSNRTTIRR